MNHRPLVVGLLLGSACSLFGLNGDPSLSPYELACSNGSPVYPLLTVGTQSGVLNQDGTSATHCSDSIDRGIDSSEILYTFSPPSTGVYEFSVYSDFDAVIYRVDEPCTDDPWVRDCTDGPGSGGTEVFSDQLFVGQPNVIAVDGYTAGAAGSFNITVTQIASGGDGDGSGTGADPDSCGWSGANGYYWCGNGGIESSAYPIECPIMADLTEGAPCQLTYQGCCDTNGNAWYCDATGTEMVMDQC